MQYYDGLKKYKNNMLAISEEGISISYGEVEDICRSMGEKIKRTIIFSFCENTIGCLCGYISFLYNHAVPLLLDENIERSLFESLIRIYEPAYLYIPKKMEYMFSGLECVFEIYGYKLLRTNYKLEKVLNDKLALLLTTSGSTGSPKLVRQSYQNIQSNAQAIADYLELDSTERPITTLPINYTYGLSIIHSHILVGATLLLIKHSLMQKEFWQFFKEYKATSFGGVPYTYEMLKKLHFFQMDLPSLRTMTQAGGKLSSELHREFAEYAQNTNRHMVIMYGQTEATARMAYLPYQKALEKCGSIGIAIPGGKFQLIDIDGKMIEEANKVGELVYEGANVTLGYAQSLEDLAKGDERNGVLVTGDMAKRDVDGYYYIVGRKKRFLKIFGNRVNLDEIEQMVKAAFPELEFACSGVDDKLYIFVTISEAEIKDKVKSFLTSRTGLNPAAFCIKSIFSIPKNEAGKILYAKLGEYYNEI